MRHLLAAFAVGVVVCVAAVSPPIRSASADAATPAQAPSPAPTPAPTPAPRPPDCASCVQCIAACGTIYAACTQKCLGMPDLPSKQACQAQCPSVAACAQACPCGGCPTLPTFPR